jgi:hypothetical protein
MCAFTCSKPSRPDHNKDRIGFCQCFLYVNSEIRPKGYVIDVYENGVFAEASGKPIANASGKHVRVRATVRNNDLRQGDPFRPSLKTSPSPNYARTLRALNRKTFMSSDRVRRNITRMSALTPKADIEKRLSDVR